MGGDEHDKALLRRHLDSQRRHILGAIDGLSDAQLRTPILPSGWHCLGLLRHLEVSDEHYWFGCVVGGEAMDELPTTPGGDWLVDDDETAAGVIGRYRDAIDRSDRIIAATGLDEPPRQPDPMWEQWGLSFPDLRSVLLHVITETAVHAGHLDAVRELLDGRQWVVLT